MAITINAPRETLTYETREAIYGIVGQLKYVITDTLPTIGTSGAVYYYVPTGCDGTIIEATTVLNGAITTDDAVITLATNNSGSFVDVTGGAITITQSGSAAADIDTVTPSAANTVAAGDLIRVTDNGDAGGSSTASISIVIRLDDVVAQG